MGYVLLAILIFELVIFYCFNGKNILSPSVLACAVFILSVAMYAFNPAYYGYEIHFNTVIFIALFLFCLFLGEFFGNAVTGGKKTLPLKGKIKNEIILPVWVCVLLAAVVLVIGVIYFFEVYRFSLTVGNTAGNYLSMAKYVRFSEETFTASVLVSQGTGVSECLLFMAVYCYVYNKQISGKRYLRYLIIVLAFIPHVLAADNRVKLLRIIIVSFIIIIFLLKQGVDWNRKKDLKIISVSVLLLVLYVLLWRLLGYRTEVSANSDAWTSIVKYTSSSIVGFDMFINGMTAEVSVYFGERTLLNVYAILNSWGFGVPKIETFEGFFRYSGGESNVYTLFKAYIQDFGYVACGLAMFFTGFLIAWLINSIRYRKLTYFKLSVLGLFFYPVLMISISNVLGSIIGMPFIYTLVYLVIIQLLMEVFNKRSGSNKIY